MSPVLELEHLGRAFGGLRVTRDVSLVLRAGERVALIGPNGAGKTTLVDLICGYLRADSGVVRNGGEDITELGPAARVRRGIVRSFQVSRLFPDLTAEEHVALAILQRDGRSGRMVGDFRRWPAVMQEVRQILALLGLSALADRKAGELAYGHGRLIEIALALALRAQLLLLDEPAAGVPPEAMGRIEAALDKLPEEMAVLMIDHDMDLVFRFAERVIVLAAGTIIFDGTPRAAEQDERVREAYLGSQAHARSRP